MDRLFALGHVSAGTQILEVAPYEISVRLGRLTAETSRCSVCAYRQGELKRGTVGYVCRGPKPATVGFHDRTADGESHPHAAGFGGEEGIEQPVRILGGDPNAAIRHTYQHLLFLVLARSDHQFCRGRVDSVPAVVGTSVRQQRAWSVPISRKSPSRSRDKIPIGA